MDSLSELLERDYGITKNPGYQYSRCLWSGTDGKPCHECAAACPNGVYPDVKQKKPDFSKCARCGACAAACPARAIAPPEVRVRSFLRALATDEIMHIACSREEGKASLRLERLSALSWEEIACAALKNGAVLSIRPCGTCPDKACFTRLMQTLDRVKRFLGDEVFFDRVQLLEEGDPAASTGNQISRRELFSLYKRLDPERANRLLPKWTPKKDSPALIWRALLRDLVQERRSAAAADRLPVYVLPLPAVSDACYDCGVCVRRCEDRALSFRTGADGESFQAVVEAWKCTGCGRCAAACRENAISGMRGMQLTKLGQVSVRRCRKYYCSECGKARKPGDSDGLCGFCRLRKKSAEKALASEGSENTK